MEYRTDRFLLPAIEVIDHTLVVMPGVEPVGIEETPSDHLCIAVGNSVLALHIIEERLEFVDSGIFRNFELIVKCLSGFLDDIPFHRLKHLEW